MSITEIIPRILQEREFLTITEESLLKEIEEEEEGERGEGREGDDDLTDGERNGEAQSVVGNEDDKLENEGLKGDEEVKTGSSINTYENFQVQKHELSKCISTALNETSLSLDFVSLLISSVKPTIGKTTMSPHLTKTVPLGSLNSDKLEVADPHKSEETSSIGQGLKLESLEKITSSFRNSSLRLNEQVLKEHTYWENIHSVLQSGEVLYKTRDPTTGFRSIGVKYGFGDSGSSYHDPGLAVLKRDSRDGMVSLLPVISSGTGGIKVADKVYKYIRVKILSKIDDDYMLTGQSIFNSSNIIQSGGSFGDISILNDIEKIRFFLFEEDLFSQLTREAKTLINYNVSIISNKIIIEVNDNIIEIESVIYDENNEDELNNLYQNINKESTMNNGKAQQILIFLKLMLCCFYKYNLNLRQGVPTARNKWKLTNSHPLILRPLLGYLRHEINFKNILYIIENITLGYKSEGLEEDAAVKILSKQYLTLQPISETKKIQDVFEKSTKSPTSEITILLRNKVKKNVLKIDLTLSASETFCNLMVNISIMKYENEKLEDGVKLLELNVSEIYDVEECLQWVISNFMKDTTS